MSSRFWSEVYDAYAGEGDLFRQTGRLKGDAFGWILDAAYLLGKLRPTFGPEAKLLTIGCANGLQEFLMGNLYHHVVAIDASEKQIYCARMNNLIGDKKRFPGIQFHHGPATRLQVVPNRSQDAVLCAGTYHLLRKDHAEVFLTEAMKRVKENGMLLLSGIPLPNLKIQLDKKQADAAKNGLDHRLFSELAWWEPDEICRQITRRDKRFHVSWEPLPVGHPWHGERYSVSAVLKQYSPEEEAYWQTFGEVPADAPQRHLPPGIG